MVQTPPELHLKHLEHLRRLDVLALRLERLHGRDRVQRGRAHPALDRRASRRTRLTAVLRLAPIGVALGGGAARRQVPAHPGEPRVRK